MKKKIGIVTWFDRGYNYGSTLQAYATQTVLQNMGYESELINYKPEGQMLKKRLKEIGKKVYLYMFNNNVYRTWVKMDKWSDNNLNISKSYNTFDQLKVETIKYDAVICGSDQIWNNSDGIIDPFYYLQFVDKDKRIAYAPSIARDYIDENLVEKFREYVKGIRCLSIREKQGAELIKKITGREANVVLDPTLLLNKDEWQMQLSDNSKLENKRFIFCYLLTKNDKYYDEIAELSNKFNIEVITPTLLSKFDETSENVDFFEFLNLIRYADYIITDSFHGVAFSLNLGKQFAVYKRFEDSYKETQNSRIYNILNEFNLNDRIVNDENKLETVLSKETDYTITNSILSKKRRESLAYLVDALEYLPPIKQFY
jgi:hypothetical protein